MPKSDHKSLIREEKLLIPFSGTEAKGKTEEVEEEEEEEKEVEEEEEDDDD